MKGWLFVIGAALNVSCTIAVGRGTCSPAQSLPSGQADAREAHLCALFGTLAKYHFQSGIPDR